MSQGIRSSNVVSDITILCCVSLKLTDLSSEEAGKAQHVSFTPTFYDKTHHNLFYVRLFVGTYSIGKTVWMSEGVFIFYI